jgi:hypothetical protein
MAMPRNRKSQGFNVDTNGNLLVLEKGTTIDAIAPAKASILKKVAAAS